MAIIIASSDFSHSHIAFPSHTLSSETLHRKVIQAFKNDCWRDILELVSRVARRSKLHFECMHECKVEVEYDTALYDDFRFAVCHLVTTSGITFVLHQKWIIIFFPETFLRSGVVRNKLQKFLLDIKKETEAMFWKFTFLIFCWKFSRPRRVVSRRLQSFPAGKHHNTLPANKFSSHCSQ